MRNPLWYDVERNVGVESARAGASMITNYLVLSSTNLNDLLTKVNGASEMGYRIVASASFGYPMQGAGVYLTPPVAELTHYVWMERYIPFGPRYTTVGPGVVVENVLGRPIAMAAGSYPPEVYRPGVWPPEVVRPGVVQPVARGVLGEEESPLVGFIKLTAVDNPNEVLYIRPEYITDMHVYEGSTQISYESGTGVKSWSIKQTPEEIIQLSHGRKVVDMERAVE